MCIRDSLCGVARVLPVVLCFRDAELKVTVLQLFADGSHDVAQAEVEVLFALSAAVQRNAEAVSYTHLDVYKRQE